MWDLVKREFRNCFVSFRLVNVKRDEFFDAISAALELKPRADTTYSLAGLRVELYDIIGQKLNLSITSRAGTGAMFSSTIYRVTAPARRRLTYSNSRSSPSELRCWRDCGP